VAFSNSNSNRGGRVLVHCFGSCFQEQVIEALRVRKLWPPLQLRVARIPLGAKDVAELLGRPGGDLAYERMIAEAQVAVAWMVDQHPAPGSHRWGLLGRALERLDAVERAAYARLLAQHLDVPEAAIRAALDDYLDGRRRCQPRWRVVRT
jgi:hypothetical protein